MAQYPFQVEHTEPAPGTMLLSLSGSILLGPESECIEGLVREGLMAGKRAFIFDLCNVKKIDSTGIGRFISAYNLVLQAQAELRMICQPGLILRSFQATRLDSVFHICASLDEALGSIKR